MLYGVSKKLNIEDFRWEKLQNTNSANVPFSSTKGVLRKTNSNSKLRFKISLDFQLYSKGTRCIWIWNINTRCVQFNEKGTQTSISNLTQFFTVLKFIVQYSLCVVLKIFFMHLTCCGFVEKEPKFQRETFSKQTMYGIKWKVQH